jgi:hypothetical protein
MATWKFQAAIIRNLIQIFVILIFTQWKCNLSACVHCNYDFGFKINKINNTGTAVDDDNDGIDNNNNNVVINMLFAWEVLNSITWERYSLLRFFSVTAVTF